jgi:hypothetical protein
MSAVFKAMYPKDHPCHWLMQARVDTLRAISLQWGCRIMLPRSQQTYFGRAAMLAAGKLLSGEAVGKVLTL